MAAGLRRRLVVGSLEITPTIARSFNPTTVSVLMESSSFRAWCGLSTGVLPHFTTYFGPRTAAPGFIADNKPVEEHANGTKVLFHTWRREGKLFDVRGDVNGPDRRQGKASLLAPGRKLRYGPSRKTHVCSGSESAP
jgi:hypothetical protein